MIFRLALLSSGIVACFGQSNTATVNGTISDAHGGPVAGSKVTAVNDAKGKDDITAIQSAASALSDSMQKIGEAMNATKPNEGATDTTPEANKEGNVRDADVTGGTDETK